MKILSNRILAVNTILYNKSLMCKLFPRPEVQTRVRPGGGASQPTTLDLSPQPALPQQQTVRGREALAGSWQLAVSRTPTHAQLLCAVPLVF